ncbi:RAD55 family ATPase [Hyperthermus butylicus]|uniref:Universally conserved protein n=1 Tax=Hyperthermus butylicus (strain DSM 5456 / JCM 9403 / PLM1-5) TaxID=415426 RepID=A2BKD6_HYPBU|nr:RAD55 family ATPase [Hyperthermus butylicus]ABM80447.1 universally conserved protein [Hyperthermus butylicus DSM 5456]
MGEPNVKFGVPILDKLLPRGIPRRSLVIMVGDSGTGKSLITQLMAGSFLQRGEKVIYVCLDDDPESIVSSMESRGIEARRYAREGKLILVDAYASRYGLETEEYVAEKISSLDIHGVSSILARLADNNGIRDSGLVILDSLNSFAFRYEPSMLYDFLNMLRVSLAKKRGITTVATFHTPTQLYAEIAATLEHMADVYIIIRYHEEALEAGVAVRELLIKKAKGVPVMFGWVKFVITDEGILEAKVRKIEG